MLILRNLGVLSLVVDLLLVDLLGDPGRLHFDSVDGVFVHGVRQVSVDLWFREPAPLPCKLPSVSLHLVAVSIGTCLLKARLSQALVCRVSFVGRYVVELSGHPRPFPRTGPRVPWVSCLDPRGCHRVQDDPVTKGQPLCVLVGVVTSCVLCARGRGRVSRSCATENTYTPPRPEAQFKLSIVAILRHLKRSLQHLCGFWVLRPVRHLVRHVLASCTRCRNPPCLFQRKSVSFSED